jgi:hypothetical protein
VRQQEPGVDDVVAGAGRDGVGDVLDAELDVGSGADPGEVDRDRVAVRADDPTGRGTGCQHGGDVATAAADVEARGVPGNTYPVEQCGGRYPEHARQHPQAIPTDLTTANHVPRRGRPHRMPAHS